MSNEEENTYKIALDATIKNIALSVSFLALAAVPAIIAALSNSTSQIFSNAAALPSLVCAASSCFLIAIYVLSNISEYRDQFSVNKLVILALLSCTLAPFIFITTLIPFFYSIIDLFYQDLFSIEFYRQEISSGTLNLRAASFFTGILLFKAFSLFSKNTRTIARICQKLGISIVSLESNNLLSKGIISESRSIYISTVLQCSYYLICSFYLWIFYTLEIQNLATLSASWLLLFIYDDWIVMGDYALAYKKRILKSHLVKVTVCNLLLLISVVAASAMTLSWSITVFLALELLAVALILSIYQWNLQSNAQTPQLEAKEASS